MRTTDASIGLRLSPFSKARSSGSGSWNRSPLSRFTSTAAGGSGKITWKLSASVIVASPNNITPNSFAELAAPQTDDDGSSDGTDDVSKQKWLHRVPAPEGEMANYRVCMLKRTAKSSFMPSAVVFPGGAVEEVDHRLGADNGEIRTLGIAGWRKISFEIVA